MLAVFAEDELSVVVAERLATEAGWDSSSLRLIYKNGSGYLRSRTDSFCEMARHGAVFVLTDLDRKACPSVLISDWFQSRERHQNLVFRIAVHEVEAWLMADRQGFAKLLGISPAKIDREPERIIDPKEALLHLASRARPEVRRELLPKKGAVAVQGLGYNSILSSFSRRDWSVDRAKRSSPSLLRALQRLRECRASMNG